MTSLDTHFYDTFVRENQNVFTNIVLSNEEVDFIWNKIIENSKDETPEFIYKKNDFDQNANFSCNKLGAFVYKNIQDSPDLIELFYLQFEDMKATSGYCAQGQTNRYLQILYCKNTDYFDR